LKPDPKSGIRARASMTKIRKNTAAKLHYTVPYP